MRWGSEEVAIFKAVKKQLSTAPILEHYDLEKPLSLACDAFPYEVGTEKPVAYVSRTLSIAEKMYSQLDKEALVIVFAK